MNITSLINNSTCRPSYCVFRVRFRVSRVRVSDRVRVMLLIFAHRLTAHRVAIHIN